MKVIKRDGRAVDYDRQKISIAIGKANKEVQIADQANQEEINSIMEYIENLDKKRMLVEDIQDIIEEKLMEINKYKLAKKYIVYRYKRALIRKQNTTDESILGLIRNENNIIAQKDFNSQITAGIQRAYIANEVSKDLTRRLLLPDKITQAEEDGVLYFHDSDYFIQPIINSSIINIKDMLENGTVVNGIKLDSPNDFRQACSNLFQIISSLSGNQYGDIIVNIEALGKYLNNTKKLFKLIWHDELEMCINMLFTQLCTQISSNGNVAQVKFIFNPNSNDEFINENIEIYKEILKCKENLSIKNNINLIYPKIAYVINKDNSLNGGKFDNITNLTIESPLNIKLLKFDNKVYSTYFNQGKVTINLPQIAIEAKYSETEFWKNLKDRLDLCKEALMCKHYALLGALSNISPLHWQYGAISRLSKDEKINSLLYKETSTLTLGFTRIKRSYSSNT